MIDTAEQPASVTGGVDTHGDVHVAAVLDSAITQQLGAALFRTTPAGYQDLQEWMVSHGPIDRIGIEGIGSYGAGLVRHLRQSNVVAVEVDRPDRQQRPRHGKTDLLGAHAAAVSVIGQRASDTPKIAEGPTEAIRTIEMVCHSAVKDRTRALNQFDGLVVTAPADLREPLGRHRTAPLDN
jgi:transposase